MPDLCVVIPMKDPVFSKQRLSPFLPSALRKALAVKLFKRTLHKVELNAFLVNWLYEIKNFNSHRTLGDT